MLSNAVLAAIQHDPQIQLYAHKLRERGKPDGIVYNNVKNKLIQRVFAVVKRQKAYVKLAVYA